MELQEHFEEVRLLIRRGQAIALRAAYTELLKVYWQVGTYVYHRLQSATWGEQVVNQLADWLKKKEPAIKQFDRRSLYRMREFYLTWHALDWEALKKDGSIVSQIESFDNQDNKFVVSLTPQFTQFPNILSSLSWTHHVEILSRTKNLEEKVFYLLLGTKEKYTVRELKRQIDSGLYERQKATRHQIAGNHHPNAEIIPQIFKDKYIFGFLDLPDPYSENDLQKGLVKYLKQFILEIGRDFTFMGEEYRLQIGKQDFYIDLLFYHRELQCLVVFELKASAFQPEFLGKLNFYLEALDREVKKPHENPSIGILLCTENDKEIVEIALSRNISPALVAEYETKLIDKDLLRRMLREWTENMTVKED
ncbi:MAG TPA: PDDEXK nuclease domain-containing protein [Puia sp.]|nr:PDDEXK nuclease domain-containing protein [Puia sp.]